MELFDYVKFRWKALMALLVIGVVAIVLLASNSGSRDYQASAQLLMVPSSSEQNAYASDPDRYVDIQLALVYTPEYLKAEVKGTDATGLELAQALSFARTTGSSVVSFEVTSDTAERAVTLVNAAATGYLDIAAKAASAPADKQAAALEKQVKVAQFQLTKAGVTIRKAAVDYAAANPGLPVPNASVLTPTAYADQTLATSRLQQLRIQQSAIELDASSSVSGSRILHPAESAGLPAGIGRTTYLAAVIGLLLILLTAAGVGLALSRRVLGPGRWSEATGDGRLGRSIRLRSLTSTQRRETVRRVAAALNAVGTTPTTTTAVYLPGQTPAMKRRTAFLFQGLADAGIPTEAAGSLDEVAALMLQPAAAHSSTPDVRVLLLVDLKQTRVDDAGVLTDYPAALQRTMVPVLV